MSLFVRIFSLLAISAISNGLVQFSNSALYDIYDFQGVKEVLLPNCDNGCLIFASTTVEYDDAYMNNLIVQDYSTGKNESIAFISQQIVTGWTQKLPYELEVPGRYSILNLNIDDSLASDLSVWVIDRTKAKSIDFEIFDAGMMARSHGTPHAVLTVMGAKRFFVKAHQGLDKHVVKVMGAKKFFVKAHQGLSNSFTARLTGFDNAKENNTDDCIYAYRTTEYNGFEFHVNGPLVSFVFDRKKPINIEANYDWQNVRNLDQAGFITTPGFHGCAKVNPLQVFRQWNEGFNGEEFDLKSDNKLNVTWTVDANVAQEIVLKDMTNSKRNSLTGVQQNREIEMDGTQFANLYYNDASPPYGFIARHSAIKA